jgi:hypothetical protein
MRLIGLALFVFTLGQTAFAADLECVRQVSEVRTHFALIDMWPIMHVQTGRQDCTGGPGFKFCVTHRDAPIMDNGNVCGYRVNQRMDCETEEWTEGFRTHIVETRCFGGIRARLEVNRNNQGRLTCTRRGRVEATYRLGECY